MRPVKAHPQSQAREWAVALAPALLLCVFAQLEIWTTEPRQPGPTWVHATLSAVTTLALVARRRLPLLSAVVAVLTNAAEVIVTGGGIALASFLAVSLAVFSLARHTQTEVAVAGGVIALIASTARDVANPTVNELDIALGWLFLVIVWAAGHALHRRHTSERSLQQEADQLRRERDEQSRTAVAAERARLARELHDVVAHSISVVAVQAGAARWVLDGQAGPVHEALVTIERTSREALTELRRLLEVLRADEPDAEHAPQRGVADVLSLVEQVRSAGQPLELEIEPPAEPLPAGVDLTAYRVVQEAVTNVLKHAPGAPTKVSVRYRSAAVEVEVVNGATAGRRVTRTPAASGHGLMGMRERVALYGGDLAVGPEGSRGFAVRASLPLQSR